MGNSHIWASMKWAISLAWASMKTVHSQFIISLTIGCLHIWASIEQFNFRTWTTTKIVHSYVLSSMQMGHSNNMASINIGHPDTVFKCPTMYHCHTWIPMEMCPSSAWWFHINDHPGLIIHRWTMPTLNLLQSPKFHFLLLPWQRVLMCWREKMEDLLTDGLLQDWNVPRIAKIPRAIPREGSASHQMEWWRHIYVWPFRQEYNTPDWRILIFGMPWWKTDLAEFPRESDRHQLWFPCDYLRDRFGYEAYGEAHRNICYDIVSCVLQYMLDSSESEIYDLIREYWHMLQRPKAFPHILIPGFPDWNG